MIIGHKNPNCIYNFFQAEAKPKKFSKPFLHSSQNNRINCLKNDQFQFLIKNKKEFQTDSVNDQFKKKIISQEPKCQFFRANFIFFHTQTRMDRRVESERKIESEESRVKPTSSRDTTNLSNWKDPPSYPFAVALFPLILLDSKCWLFLPRSRMQTCVFSRAMSHVRLMHEDDSSQSQEKRSRSRIYIR